MYKICYTDPPWVYSNQQSNDPKRGGYRYKNLTMEAIAQIPYAEFMDEDSLIFMWVTGPKTIEIAQKVVPGLEAQGYKFVTKVFSWIKLNPTGSVVTLGKDIWLEKGVYSGLGYWTCGNTEDVWLFRKGKPQRISKSVKQPTFAPRGGEHSEKPAEIKSKILELVGDLPRLEMFAREKTHGFDVWGNQIDSDIDLVYEDNVWKFNGKK